MRCVCWRRKEELFLLRLKKEATVKNKNVWLFVIVDALIYYLLYFQWEVCKESRVIIKWYETNITFRMIILFIYQVLQVVEISEYKNILNKKNN